MLNYTRSLGLCSYEVCRMSLFLLLFYAVVLFADRFSSRCLASADKPSLHCHVLRHLLRSVNCQRLCCFSAEIPRDRVWCHEVSCQPPHGQVLNTYWPVLLCYVIVYISCVYDWVKRSMGRINCFKNSCSVFHFQWYVLDYVLICCVYGSMLEIAIIQSSMLPKSSKDYVSFIHCGDHHHHHHLIPRIQWHTHNWHRDNVRCKLCEPSK